MEPLPRLTARISSLRELKELMGALRVLAASRVQEARSALDAIRRYAAEVEEAIASGAALLERAGAPGAFADTPDGDALIVICSEHGFVGGLNDRLLARAEALHRDDRALVVVGRRGATLAEERGLTARWSLPMATHVGGVPAIARRVADRLATSRTADVVFASYKHGGAFEIETASVLPLGPALFAKADAHGPPLHHLEPDLLLARLAEEYLFAEIMHAMMESLTSENGARLEVMEAANHNIEDKLEGLRRAEHSLRQQETTSELLDVVTGAEAVLGSADR